MSSKEFLSVKHALTEMRNNHCAQALVFFLVDGHVYLGNLLDLKNLPATEGRFRPINLPDILTGSSFDLDDAAAEGAFSIWYPYEDEILYANFRRVLIGGDGTTEERWMPFQADDTLENLFGELVWYGDPCDDQPAFTDSWNLRSVFSRCEDDPGNIFEGAVLFVDGHGWRTLWKASNFEPGDVLRARTATHYEMLDDEV